jgi:Bacterial protein of unknown function (DUF885)
MHSLRRFRHPISAALWLVLFAGAARAESGPESLTRLSDAYLGRWLTRHPAAATALGAHHYDGMLPEVSETTLDQDLVWTREVRTRVAAIPERGLGPTARADRAVLLAALDRDLVLLSDVRPWRSDPACVLPLVDDAIAVLADPRRGPSCHRLPLLAERLTRVPEVLRAARVLLTEPDSAAVAAAIPRFEELTRFYRTGVGISIMDCRDGSRQAQFAEADTAAVKAVVEFTRALRTELLPTAGHAPPLARDLVVRWLACEGITGVTPESLLTRAESESAGTSGVAPGAPIPFADSSAVLVWLRDAVTRAPAGFALRQRPFTAPVGHVPLRAGIRRLEPGAGWSVTPFGPGPWEPVGRGWTLEAWTPLPGEFDATRAREAVDRSLVDLARADARRALPSALRQALVWDATRDGTRSDLVAGSGAADEAAATARWLRTLLAGAGPGVPYVAPRDGLVALGRWRLEALREETRHTMGRQWDTRAFHDAVLTAGDAPWPLVREWVLAHLTR